MLLIGVVLCATIAWAALGFLLMGIGLISLQVAERGRRRAGLTVAGSAAASTGFVPPSVVAGLQPPTSEPAQRDGPPARQPRRVTWPANGSDAPYDREAWHRLVESDPDIARLAKVLADYGPQYVDELAINYLAAPDKARLGGIVDGIIARASGGQPAPAPKPTRGSQPPSPEPQGLVAPETARPGSPPPLPANPTDALEASLIAAVEQASARSLAQRIDPPKDLPKDPPKDLPKDLPKDPPKDPPKPARAEARPAPVTRREPEFGRVPRQARPDHLLVLPPLSNPSADLEASLIAAVTEASAKRADAPKPAPPSERPPDNRAASTPPPPAPPPAGAPADDRDEALLAALAEISGENRTNPPEPAPAAKEPPSPPADADLSDMIKKFAPDSNFLRKT
ncbi:hypothetical protein AS156_07960 [Bradyrhizobium macuxiense]|uniref:Uncharacterized protein n=1 Tax=Bradyrhizobium macuxiense TaxID=1755647 RepID=A0A120FMJ5_9BRAD|nr:hypothetical protein AS156_07960 [Bradyrhizobium macuxiense]